MQPLGLEFVLITHLPKGPLDLTGAYQSGSRMEHLREVEQFVLARHCKSPRCPYLLFKWRDLTSVSGAAFPCYYVWELRKGCGFFRLAQPLHLLSGLLVRPKMEEPQFLPLRLFLF